MSKVKTDKKKIDTDRFSFSITHHKAAFITALLLFYLYHNSSYFVLENPDKKTREETINPQ
jgi:hypothetical protein